MSLDEHTLGWLRNFLVDLKSGWGMYSAEKSIYFNSGMFRCFTTLENDEFNILPFSSLLVMCKCNFFERF